MRSMRGGKQMLFFRKNRSRGKFFSFLYLRPSLRPVFYSYHSFLDKILKYQCSLTRVSCFSLIFLERMSHVFCFKPSSYCWSNKVNSKRSKTRKLILVFQPTFIVQQYSQLSFHEWPRQRFASEITNRLGRCSGRHRMCRWGGRFVLWWAIERFVTVSSAVEGETQVAPDMVHVRDK